MNTAGPVRSLVLKHLRGRLVVAWVTSSESRLLKVVYFFLPEQVSNHYFHLHEQDLAANPDTKSLL
jgi:hypothetical protein